MRRDHAFVDHGLEVDHPVPIIAAEQQDRQRPHLAGLDQGQQLEHFVERAEAAREDSDCARAQQEVHLAKREIVELEAQVRGHIGVGHLLVRKHDIEPDRFGADVGRAAVRRLHDRRAAARADDEMALALLVAAAAAGEPGKLPRHVIIFRLGLQPLGDLALLLVDWSPRRSARPPCRAPGSAPSRRRRRSSRCRLRRGTARASSARAGSAPGEDPRAAGSRCPGTRACRPRFRLRDRRDMLRRAGIDLRRREDALGWARLVSHPAA